jgi:hypothetical protein
MAKKKKPDTPAPEKPTSILSRFDGLDLNPQMERFVISYCADYTFNATRAYKEVYDNEMESGVAASAASRLLRGVNVREAVRRQMERQLEDKDALARRIIDEHSKIAFAHSAMIMDGISSFGYVVKDFADIPDEYKAAIAGFKKTETGLLEVKFYDKQKSLDSLARILGMFDDAAAKVGEKYEDLIARARASKQQEGK